MAELVLPTDLFDVAPGATVGRGLLQQIVIGSKQEKSRHWAGRRFSIYNSPQQGINWMGEPPNVQAVLIKKSDGKYVDDGWLDQDQTLFRYSFKVRKGRVNHRETANRVLIDQPDGKYPVLVFSAQPAKDWSYLGEFRVVRISETTVDLARAEVSVESGSPLRSEAQTFQEGGWKYTNHLVRERSRAAVRAVKLSRRWICEICGVDFEKLYGAPYIEAHHLQPLASAENEYSVSTDDFALLCPNCHKAVHIHMANGLAYEEIQDMISRRFEPFKIDAFHLLGLND